MWLMNSFVSFSSFHLRSSFAWIWLLVTSYFSHLLFCFFPDHSLWIIILDLMRHLTLYIWGSCFYDQTIGIWWASLHCGCLKTISFLKVPRKCFLAFFFETCILYIFPSPYQLLAEGLRHLNDDIYGGEYAYALGLIRSIVWITEMSPYVQNTGPCKLYLCRSQVGNCLLFLLSTFSPVNSQSNWLIIHSIWFILFLSK